MCAYPTTPPLVMKPNSIGNIDDPDIQVQLRPMERMKEVAQLVYEGGYILPETPTPPPLTIIPGDRQVTITWSNINVNTADAYYKFIQAHPEVDPDEVYREYDFEGYRLYRNYVGPSEAHAEKIFECSMSAGNVQFHYIDTRDKDDPYYRIRNGMKVWYSLVAYDRNYDPKTGDEFSLPDPAQSKTWNRTAPEGYYTVRPRSDASNFSPAELTTLAYEKPSAYSVEPAEVTSVTLAGTKDANNVTWLTEDPAYVVPAITPTFEVVNNERITQDQTYYLMVSSDMGPNGYRAGRRYVVLADASGNVIDDSAPLVVVRQGGSHNSKASYAGGMSDNGVSWNIAAAFQGARQGNVWTQIESGGYTDTVGLNTASNWNTATGGATYNGTSIYQGLLRTGGFEITWQNSGGSVTVAVTDKTHGRTVPFSPYVDGDGWGFMPDGTKAQNYRSQFGIVWEGFTNVETPQSSRATLLVQTLPADNTKAFNLWVNGQMIHFTGGSVTMPANGTVMKLRTAFGSWSGTTFTQNPDILYPGDKWKIGIKAMSMTDEQIDLTKVRVVPNPYIASSVLDQSSGGRRIEFVNLPDRCTIRIYTLGGNLVNVLNHIGAGRTGWGNYTDVDAIQPDNTPLAFTGYDNHSGTEAWNLKNRFGQTVASGLYFFHVTDIRGMTHTGKFYIIN